MNHRIIAAVDDMFFAAKIRTTAEHLGIKIDFPKSADAIVQSAKKELPALVIVDLHSQRYDAFGLAQQMKSDEQLRDVPIVGFFSHVQTELQQKAQQAGINHVLARSAFTKNLADILQMKSFKY